MMARIPATTIIQAQGPAKASANVRLAKLAVPMRQELYTPDKVDTPQGVATALQAMARHVDEVSFASRSYPFHGGTYWPNVAFQANTKIVFAHGCTSGLAVAWREFSVRPTGAVANAVTNGRRVEISQDAPTGRITLSSNEAATVDLHFFTRPVAP